MACMPHELSSRGAVEGRNRVASRWVPIPGDVLRSHNPASPGETVWLGGPRVSDVDEAVDAAASAFPAWSAWPMARRVEALRAFQSLARSRAEVLTELIVRETGKARWDAAAEARLLGDKVDITLEEGESSGLRRVTGFEIPLGATRTGRALFRAHGVMAVLGPFNFPAHLPNGHMVPALLMGNCVVFKPSDKAPAVGQFLGGLFADALDSVGAPPGVFNLVHGGSDVAARLASHVRVGGVLFTGSWAVGRRIMEANLDHPGRILALEMGGNNASVVMPDADLKQAAIECARSALVTTGQRCTCTRRVIVHGAVAERFIAMVRRIAETVVIGDPARGAGVFAGPLIREEARRSVLEFQSELLGSGGEAVLRAGVLESQGGGHFVSPGIVKVRRFTLDDDARRSAGCDVEVFGPVLRISVTDSLQDAIEQSNASRFGLAASIFTKDHSSAEEFLNRAKAGCINVNTGTAGASSRLPFGGLDRSGNHRPAGSFSLDYCAYPVAAMIESGDAASVPEGMRWDDDWARHS